eukprot:194368_1
MTALTLQTTLWCAGNNSNGEFGIGNNVEQKQLIKCGWSEKMLKRSCNALNIAYNQNILSWCILVYVNSTRGVSHIYHSQSSCIIYIYASNRGYTVVEDMNGNYYSAGCNGHGACTVNNESCNILTMTPIT